MRNNIIRAKFLLAVIRTVRYLHICINLSLEGHRLHDDVQLEIQQKFKFQSCCG